jgi:hypothetical protein
MIEKNTSDEIEADTTFSQHLWLVYKGRKVTFRAAKQEIINYARKNNAHIPNYFESIMALFEEEAPSEVDEPLPPPKHHLTQRAKHEEDRIYAANRELNRQHPREFEFESVLQHQDTRQ